MEEAKQDRKLDRLRVIATRAGACSNTGELMGSMAYKLKVNQS